MEISVIEKRQDSRKSETPIKVHNFDGGLLFEQERTSAISNALRFDVASKTKAFPTFLAATDATHPLNAL